VLLHKLLVLGYNENQEEQEMMGFSAKTKKAAKELIGQNVAGRFVETSVFGPEYRSTGTHTVVGPSPYERKWFAELTVKDGVLVGVR
jgi:hypothetical protein